MTGTNRFKVGDKIKIINGKNPGCNRMIPDFSVKYVITGFCDCSEEYSCSRDREVYIKTLDGKHLGCLVLTSGIVRIINVDESIAYVKQSIDEIKRTSNSKLENSIEKIKSA